MKWKLQQARAGHVHEPSDIRGGFTLIELLVVTVMIGLWALALVPTLARTQPKTRSLVCLNNNRQLCAAWSMYAQDNRDRLVFASDDGTGLSNPLNKYAWTQGHLDYDPNNRANWDITYDLVKGPLWPYTGRSPSIYKCPSDQSAVVVQGTRKPRVRTMAMNLYLGGFLGTEGGWAQVRPCRIFTGLADLSAPSLPGPSEIFVFLDLREDLVNWGNFFTDMTGYPNQPALYTFTTDAPGMYHNRGCTFSFADGRAMLKHWTDPRTTPPLTKGVYPLPWPGASPNNPDVAWLQAHATRPK